MKKTNDNSVFLKGKLTKPIRLFTKNKVSIYAATLETKRYSGIIDYIPIRLTQTMLSSLPADTDFVEISGAFRSYRKNDKLILYVWTNSIKPIFNEEYENTIYVSGFLCKKAPPRQTILTNKIVVDYILNVSQLHKNYFPFIAWNKKALEIASFPLGSNLTVIGRIQSRDYQKNYENGESEVKTAYEISTSSYNINF